MHTMQPEGRYAWRGKAAYTCNSPTARWRATGSARIPGRTLPGKPARCYRPVTSQIFTPFTTVAPQSSIKVLEGFCPEPCPEEQIAVHSNGLMLFLRLTEIEWLEEADDCVALHMDKQTHVLRETLAAIVAKLPPGRFLRIGPRTLVNVQQIKDLQPLRHRRCRVLLRSGTRLTFVRS
jgi:DNA-binding LytR/AlgR family response regulator